MTQLTVYVSGQGIESRLLTLPVDVYAPDGTILAQGTASPRHSATFDLPVLEGRVLDRVHVLATMPNGASLQETVELRDGQAEVTLHQGEQSPHEWLQWVTPFRSLSHLKSDGKVSTGVHRWIGQVWMTLWTLQDGRWKAQDMQAFDHQHDTGMQQLVIDVPLSSNLLQIGGEEVAWRLVSLPPGGAVRVALTRSATEEGDSLEITIGRSRPDDELIMSYLARGAIAEADRLAEAWDVADMMLQEKKQDPISAAAGAYLLLRNRRLQQRRDWVDNLVEWFPYMADGAIVSAALALQREDVKESEIRARLDVALGRGLPIFAMGATVLVETMAAVHRGKRETKRFHAAYLAAQAYARAVCSKGAYFAFYGKSPAEPSWTPIYGLEDHAVASPASARSTEEVAYARSRRGKPVGKFGATRVDLPRAPVSAEVAKELLIEARRLDERSVEIRQIRERVMVEPGVLKAMAHPRQAASSPRPQQLERVRSAPAKRVPRQTEEYWRDERLKHAVTIFKGDE